VRETQGRMMIRPYIFRPFVVTRFPFTPDGGHQAPKTARSPHSAPHAHLATKRREIWRRTRAWPAPGSETKGRQRTDCQPHTHSVGAFVYGRTPRMQMRTSSITQRSRHPPFRSCARPARASPWHSRCRRRGEEGQCHRECWPVRQGRRRHPSSLA